MRHTLQMYSEAASPTLRSSKRIMNDVKNLMTQIDNAPECSEDIVCLVYGACYVMSIDKQQGIIWGKTLSTTPKLLALQLTFNRKTLAKRIEQSLFKKVYTYTCLLLGMYHLHMFVIRNVPPVVLAKTIHCITPGIMNFVHAAHY